MRAEIAATILALLCVVLIILVYRLGVETGRLLQQTAGAAVIGGAGTPPLAGQSDSKPALPGRRERRAM